MTAATLAVTQYCERSGAGFWAEPLNALTNAAFLVAALLIVRRLYAVRSTRWDVWLLAVLAAAVGIGSFLWHTLATAWSEWTDVIPIALFIDVFLLTFLRRVARLSWTGVLGAFALYQVVNYAALAGLPADWLNGSVFYLPAWAALLAMALYCRGRVPGAGAALGVMLILFTVSLCLRSADAALCAQFPAGTHFAWHLLNAVVLYRAMRLVSD